MFLGFEISLLFTRKYFKSSGNRKRGLKNLEGFLIGFSKLKISIELVISYLIKTTINNFFQKQVYFKRVFY